MLNNREKWIFILTVMKTSQTGKSMPMKTKQGVMEFLRKNLCKDVSYEDWLSMELDIKKAKSEVMDLMFEGVQYATKNKLPPEAQKMFSEADLGELDTKVRGQLENIDFGKLKKILEKLSEKERKELEPMFENVENLAGEYKIEKKRKE